MSTLLPNKPQDIFDLMKYAMLGYKKLLSSSFILIILLTLSLGILIYFTDFSSYVLNLVFTLVSVVCMLFFWGAMLYQSDAVLKGSKISTLNACIYMGRRSAAFFGACLIMGLGITGYFYLIHWLIHVWAGEIDSNTIIKTMIILFVFFIVPVCCTLIFFWFTLPLTILDKYSSLKALLKSPVLVGERWLQALTIYMGIGVLYIFTSPYTLHAHFFKSYHVLLAFDFVIYCLLLPLFLNYVVLLLNDFKLRFSEG